MPTPRIPAETAEQQTLDEIREWHQGVADALLAQRAAVLQAIRDGTPVGPRFLGMTEDGVHEHFRLQRRELERLTMFNLVASAEASIRVDFYRRIRERRKDPFSVRLRAWFRLLSSRKQLRPDFDEGGILQILKESGVMDNAVIGRFRECLQVRHWIGHGRVWAKPVVLELLDPDEVHARALAVLQALPT